MGFALYHIWEWRLIPYFHKTDTNLLIFNTQTVLYTMDFWPFLCTVVMNHEVSFTKVSCKYLCCPFSLKPQLWRWYKNLNPLTSCFLNNPCFLWHFIDFPENKSANQKDCRNLWNIIFLIFLAFTAHQYCKHLQLTNIANIF